ncbi:MAG: hypothetical protein PHO37_07910 [Kiritimatiellae bacterium]|nr:hypothetical protein [Kiritimatiellia bacterium]
MSSAMLWLAEQQRDDGFWGEKKDRIKLTCLAVEAFLFYGHFPGNSPEYSGMFVKALDALISDVNLNGKLLKWCLKQPPTINPCMRHL